MRDERGQIDIAHHAKRRQVHFGVDLRRPQARVSEMIADLFQAEALGEQVRRTRVLTRLRFETRRGSVARGLIANGAAERGVERGVG